MYMYSGGKEYLLWLQYICMYMYNRSTAEDTCLRLYMYSGGRGYLFMAIYPLWSWFTVGSLSPGLSLLPIFGNCLQHKGCKGGGYQSESIRKAAPAPGQCSCQGHCSSPGSILLPCTIHLSRVNAPVGSVKIFLCRYYVFVQLQSSCLHTTHLPCMYVCA